MRKTKKKMKMILSISCIKNTTRKNEKGQALIESILVTFVLFLSFFLIIEMLRLLTYKVVLSVSTDRVAKELAFFELKWKKEQINKDGNCFYIQDFVRKKMQEKIEKNLSKLPTSLLSFESGDLLFQVENKTTIDIQFIRTQCYQKEKYEPGVYVQSSTCLPVLFSYFYFSKNSKSDKIGKYENMRNCLGQFGKGDHLPFFWFKLRSAAYAPWPASSQIFLHGFPSPKNLFGLENSNRNRIHEFLEKQDLRYFLKRTK